MVPLSLFDVSIHTQRSLTESLAPGPNANVNSEDSAPVCALCVFYGPNWPLTRLRARRVAHKVSSGISLYSSLYIALPLCSSLSPFLSRSAFAYFDVYKYTAICFCCSDATLMDKGAASVRQPVCV